MSIILGAPQWTDHNPHLSTGGHIYAPIPPYGQSAAGPMPSGASSWVTPAVHIVALAGVVLRSYYDDYYHRIHLRPMHIDLGSLTDVQTRQVEVWNAHLAPRSLTAITTADAEGLTFTGPLPPPTAFAPLEARTYTLQATPDGPPNQDASFRLLFGAEAPVLRVLVRRVVVWPIGPDWAHGVRERLEWATDVLYTHAGREQRVQLRAQPRQSIEYTALIGSDRDRVRMEQLLISWQSRPYGVPMWMDATVAQAPINAGATAINIDTTYRAYAVGGVVALLHGTDYEAAEITAMTATSITLRNPLSRAWPIGTRIAPVRTAYLDANLDVGYPTGAIANSVLRWRSADEVAIPVAAETADYLGYPVLATPTDWSEDIDAAYARDLEEIDVITGRYARIDRSGVSTQRRAYRWIMRGRANTAALRSWLAARSGRLRPVWVPSGMHDIRVTAPIGASDTALIAEARGHKLSVSMPGRRDLMILTASGARYYRRIVGVTETGAHEQIGINAALGVTLQPADVRMVSYMMLARLDADAVEILYHTDDLVEVSVMLRSLVDA